MVQPQDDPITRLVEKDVEEEGLSPMAPPDAYQPPKIESVPREDMAPFLQKLMEEHDRFEEELKKFEKALGRIPEEGISKESDKTLRDFFYFFDNEVVEHHRREEKELFPLLQEKLLEIGEHAQHFHGERPGTSIDLMEDEHVKSIQLTAIVFNFFALAVRLPDSKSRLLTLDASIEQGKALVEMLRLHIFREDNIIFPLAHKHIDAGTLEKMGS
jgi:hemerythrin-like domain-containing protein